ncbi:MAG: PAS domain S-box protein [Pirellulales bacterium]|nr:PAS domain S-box protein [Pirellulales bacterium]
MGGRRFEQPDCVRAGDGVGPLPSELSYRLLVEGSKDVIWSADLDLNFTYISPVVEEVLGFTPAEAAARPLSESMTSASAELVWNKLADLLAAGRKDPSVFDRSHTVEVEFHHKKGHVVKAEIRTAFIRDDRGKPVGILGVTRDVGEYKRAEESLQRSEDRYRRLVETTSEWVWEVDAEAVYTYAGPKVKKLLGYEPEEIVGRTVFDLMPPEEALRVGKAFGKIAAAHEPLIDFENILLHKNGDRVIVETTGVPLFDSNGRFVGYQGCDRDVTARRMAEKMLKDYSAALEEANRSLKDLYVAAKSATRAKSEFLANMSHEIRSPMTSILGFAEILLGNLREPENLEAATTIKRNGEYLLNLINDILDLTKIEAGKLTIEPIEFSPAAVVKEIASSMRGGAMEKGLAFDVDFDGPIPALIRSDPLRLRQILLNLLGNAIKFTDRGGVRLCVRRESDAAGRPRLRFDVSDTGIGVSEDQIASLFRPFVQGDSSTNKRFGGTGLGLAISKRLAKLLGGDIAVSGSPGRGSTFSLTIAAGPVNDAEMIDADERAVEAARPKSLPEGASALKLDCRLLLVEDGVDNQRLIAFILEKAGAKVLLAENGRVALEMVHEAQRGGRPFDLILMDMQMPVLDGYETTRLLRAEGFDRPIVALTAHAMAGDRAKCIEAGCSDYVSKPIDRARLLNAVARLVEQDVEKVVVGQAPRA